MKVSFVKSAPAKSGAALIIINKVTATPYRKLGGKAFEGAAKAAGFTGKQAIIFRPM